MSTKTRVTAFALAALVSLGFAGAACAQDASGASQGGHFGGRGGQHNGVFGTVTTVSGTTLSVTGMTRPGSTGAPAPTYTVDASNATVVKNNATGTIADVVAGDKVMVRGAVNGTSVTATEIRDGLTQGGFGEHRGQNGQGGPAEGRGGAQVAPSSVPQQPGQPSVTTQPTTPGVGSNVPQAQTPEAPVPQGFWGHIVSFFRHLF